MNNYCVLILSHGRADRLRTLDTLKRYGYTGAWFILIDNEDKTQEEYIRRFGEDHVITFNKAFVSHETDTLDNFDNRNIVVYARNASFEVAKNLGYRYFITLDDDYYYFGIRTAEGACKITDLDYIFDMCVEYVKNTNITTLAWSQSGDHIGGFEADKLCKRKAMNIFVCDTERPFKFSGRINEDVNAYVGLGATGNIFLSVMNLQLDQEDTQQNKGGLTDAYLASGTYVKSFYSVITVPSCVKVKGMGVHSVRMHHSIDWEYAVPKIVSEKYRKIS